MEKVCQCGHVNVNRFTCQKCHASLYPQEVKPMSDNTKRALRRVREARRILKETYLVGEAI